MKQNSDLLIYNGAQVLPEHLIVQVTDHKNGGWDLNPKKEVKVTHIPTGLNASCMDDRSKHRNCISAKQKLAALLAAHGHNNLSERLQAVAAESTCKTININGFEVPEPLKNAPKAGSEWFAPCLSLYGSVLKAIRCAC